MKIRRRFMINTNEGKVVGYVTGDYHYYLLNDDGKYRRCRKADVKGLEKLIKW